MRNPHTIDSRELIPFDYNQMSAEQLEALKCNLWHDIVQASEGVHIKHREFNAVKLALRDKEQKLEGQGQHETSR